MLFYKCFVNDIGIFDVNIVIRIVFLMELDVMKIIKYRRKFIVQLSELDIFLMYNILNWIRMYIEVIFLKVKFWCKF